MEDVAFSRFQQDTTQTRIAIAKFIDKLLRHDRVTLFLFSFAYLTVKYVRG